MAFALHTGDVPWEDIVSLLPVSVILCSDRCPSVTCAAQTGLLLWSSWWKGSNILSWHRKRILCGAGLVDEVTCWHHLLQVGKIFNSPECFDVSVLGTSDFIMQQMYLCTVDTTLPHQHIFTTFQTLAKHLGIIEFKMDFSWVISFQREVTIYQGAEPCQSPHGGIWDILAKRFTTGLPLWFCLDLSRKCYYGFNSMLF